MIRACLLAVCLPAFAHDAKKPSNVTMTALVVDTGCYAPHHSTGEKHRRCATACAKAGVPLALLEEKWGTLYLVVAVDHKNPNERLMPFVERRVTVTGRLMEKGGMKGIALRTVAGVA